MIHCENFHLFYITFHVQRIEKQIEKLFNFPVTEVYKLHYPHECNKFSWEEKKKKKIIENKTNSKIFHEYIFPFEILLQLNGYAI